MEGKSGDKQAFLGRCKNRNTQTFIIAAARCCIFRSIGRGRGGRSGGGGGGGEGGGSRHHLFHLRKEHVIRSASGASPALWEVHTVPRVPDRCNKDRRARPRIAKLQRLPKDCGSDQAYSLKIRNIILRDKQKKKTTHTQQEKSHIQRDP